MTCEIGIQRMMGFQGQYYRVFPRFNRPYQSEIFGHKSATSIAAARVTDFTPILASFHQRDKMPYQIAVTMAMIGIEALIRMKINGAAVGGHVQLIVAHA